MLQCKYLNQIINHICFWEHEKPDWHEQTYYFLYNAITNSTDMLSFPIQIAQLMMIPKYIIFEKYAAFW